MHNSSPAGRTPRTARFLAAALCGLLAAAAAPAGPEASPRQGFVMIYRPGENWAQRREYLPRHSAHIDALVAAGKTPAAGAWADGKGTMAILSVRDHDEAKEIVATDPFVVARVVASELHPWGPRLPVRGDLARAAAGRSFFVILLRPGAEWAAGLPLERQPLAEHDRYWQEAHQAGVLIIGDTFGDAAGALAVVALPDAAAAERFVRDDPAVRSRLLTGEAHPWPVGSRLLEGVGARPGGRAP